MNQTNAPLSLDEGRRIREAEGWIELGDWQEAQKQLDELPGLAQGRAEVLQTRWQIRSHLKDWKTCLDIALKLTKQSPENVQYWIWLAYSTRRTAPKGLGAAKEVLQAAHVLFPKEPMICFNLACYEAQLDRLVEADDWLQRALDRAKSEGPNVLRFYRKLAAEDSDLQPLREAQEDAAPAAEEE